METAEDEELAELEQLHSDGRISEKFYLTAKKKLIGAEQDLGVVAAPNPAPANAPTPPHPTSEPAAAAAEPGQESPEPGQEPRATAAAASKKPAKPKKVGKPRQQLLSAALFGKPPVVVSDLPIGMVLDKSGNRCDQPALPRARLLSERARALRAQA